MHFGSLGIILLSKKGCPSLDLPPAGYLFCFKFVFGLKFLKPGKTHKHQKRTQATFSNADLTQVTYLRTKQAGDD